MEQKEEIKVPVKDHLNRTYSEKEMTFVHVPEIYK
jgi:hypothetical protein